MLGSHGSPNLACSNRQPGEIRLADCFLRNGKQEGTVPQRMSFYLHRLSALDAAWCLRINCSSRYPSVRSLFRLVSRLGDGVFWYALMLGLLALYGRAALPTCVHMLLAGGCGTLVYKLLKHYTLRPRPYQVIQAISLGTAPLDKFSFPSGHTLHAVTFTLVALEYYPWLAWLLLPFTLLVAASRLVLGLHYPTDVLAGAALGAMIAEISLSVT